MCGEGGYVYIRGDVWRCSDGGGGVEWWQYAEMVWRCVEMGVVYKGVGMCEDVWRFEEMMLKVWRCVEMV